LIAVTVAGALSATAGASASNGVHRFFGVRGTPTIGCELAAGVPGLGTFVYCLSAPTPAKGVSVQMSAAGKLQICRGEKCLSNPPDGEAMLRPGQSVTAGPFRCTVVKGPTSKSSVRCLVTKLGHGFLLGPHGLTRL
jgi:hypothetical protein